MHTGAVLPDTMLTVTLHEDIEMNCDNILL